MMKRFFAIFITIALVFSLLPSKTAAADTKIGNLSVNEILRLDFGGNGTEKGYVGVPASKAYSTTDGYGFANTDAVDNVSASGKGALSDAVRFNPNVPNHVFNIDLPVGVYKITVTTGDVRSTTIKAEGIPQLFFLTGNNAVDTFTIPVTDGQLNIYAGSGVGTEFSISALEIKRVSSGKTTKPTIWTCGDSTVASYYNVAADAKRGWGQYLDNYIDVNKYDIRNISASGITSKALHDSLFPTVEYYGKKDDIILLAVGINDFIKQHTEHPDAIDPSEYISYMTEMIRRAKAKGMTVYLVKQQGELYDCTKYPLLTYKWFGKELDDMASAHNVSTIDLYRPWLEFCMEHTVRVARNYYSDGLHSNELGADMLAGLVYSQLFPEAKPNGDSIEDPYKDFDTPSTIHYESEASGKPVVNPHKGYVMTVYAPWAFEASNPYGIGGSMNNTAWKMSTICSGEPKWEELNPAEGVYNWESIDGMLEACEKYGMTYGIRILPYSHLSGSHDNYGEAHDFVPQWVYDKGAKKERATLVSDPSVELDLPVWDDPIYVQACKDFAAALAEHYDGDPRVEFIDISTFGNWGEWHTSTFNGNDMPSVEIQKDMIRYYSELFDKTWLCLTSGAYGEVYDYALSLGVPKRVNGLIASHNNEWNLRPTYKANLPVIGENFLPYRMMLTPEVAEEAGIVKNYDDHYLRWTPQRFRETIEISHLSIYAFDQDSLHSYNFYKEQKELIEEMNNRLGYNFTVTSAKRNGNKLKVTIKNTGLAPAFFNIDLCAEITDKNGNKLESFGKPVRIEKGSFHDESEKAYLFEYNGTLDEDATICLAMYDSDNYLVAGKNPTIKFDNKNTFSTNRLLLVAKNNHNTHADSDKDGKCDDCGYEMHNHYGNLVEQKDATCTAYGVKAYYKCSCGKYFIDSACTKEIADLSTWKSGNGRIDKASHIGGTASCTEKAKCSVCKEEYGTTADHKYDVKWNTDKTNHWHKCTVCEKESDISAHTDSDKNGKCDICLYLTNKYPSIIIDKKDAIVKIEGIVTTKEVQSNTLLEGAVFGLYAKEDIYNEEGKLIATEGTLIEREVTGADGMASFFSSLPHGKYYVREMEAPAGYIKADKCIEIDASKESSDTNTIRFEGEFENYPIKLEIYGSTSENRKQITTIFSIIDSDAHVIESWTHNNKTHYVERIPIGKYTLKKEINFYGYSFTSDMAFEVTETKEIQKISIENTLESGVITIKKICENSGKGIIGTEFEIRNKDGDVIETLVTDKNGLAKSDLLPIGISQTDSVTYYIAETKASVGYIHDETVHKVEFRYSGKGSEAIAYTLELTGKSSESDPVQTTDTSNTYGIVIAITFSAIVLAGIIIFLWKKKKKDEQAKKP